MSLSGKVALITGGAQGIGRVLCEAVLKKGGKVCLVDVNKDQGKHTEDALRGTYGADNVSFVQCDVTSKTQLENTFQKCKDMFGAMDIVANNAGIANEDLWEKTIDINLTAVTYGTMLGLKHMRKDAGGNGGVVINTASLAGIMPSAFAPVYTATKFGVVGLTRSYGLMVDYPKHGVRVNCLCPAFIDTAILENIRELRKGDDNAEQGRLILKEVGTMSPSVMATAFLMLVEDEKQNGAVVRITRRKGIEYMKYNNPPMPPLPEKPKSKY